MKTKHKYHSEWEHDMQGNLTCMHFTDGEPTSSPKLDKDMMISHCFLEFLDLLKVIEYSRVEGMTVSITTSH